MNASFNNPSDDSRRLNLLRNWGQHSLPAWVPFAAEDTSYYVEVWASPPVQQSPIVECRFYFKLQGTHFRTPAFSDFAGVHRGPQPGWLVVSP